MPNAITWVGLDAHSKFVTVAMLVPGNSDAVLWQEPYEPAAVHRLSRRLKREAPGEVRCCYEAGPTGYGLQRQLAAEGITCMVVAPSLIPRKPGDRIKTDRRDAVKLAELHRSGMLTEVCPPTEQDEELRDLWRCREDVREDLHRARHRLGKFLLRRGRMFRGCKHRWGTRHMTWLRQQRFESATAQATMDSYLLSIEQLEERLHQLEVKLGEQAVLEPYREPVEALRCFRGIDTVSAIGLIAELHTFARFESPRRLMAYVGLVPSEHSSGGDRRLGGITCAGNRHARRLLIEAAWHQRHRPVLSVPLKRRREGQPARVIAIADRAQERLHARWIRMSARGKPHNKVVVAMARELVGYLWAALKSDREVTMHEA